MLVGCGLLLASFNPPSWALGAAVLFYALGLRASYVEGRDNV